MNCMTKTVRYEHSKKSIANCMGTNVRIEPILACHFGKIKLVRTMAQDKIKLKNQLLDLKGIIRKAINLENENFDQLAV